jgi:hypothetical protein
MIAMAFVAIARPPPSLPLPLLRLPLPSLSHTTLITNAMALAALTLFVAHHPHSPSPLTPLPSLLLPSSSVACSCHLLSPAIVVMWLLMLSCHPPPAFNGPVNS